MGARLSTASVVTSGVKDQAAGSGGMYSLVAMGSSKGLLTELMNTANRTKNYKEVDEAIVKHIKPFLCNDGRGKIVHIKQLVDYRRRSRGSRGLDPRLPKPMLWPEDVEDREKMLRGNEELWEKYGSQNVMVCWDVQKRGTLGENVIHICFINATSTDMDVAKRILHHFPNLINDYYLDDLFYGESALHIAIVNEDPVMVKFLLDNGADYHQRCTGKFFTIDDQKSRRKDSYEHEWYDLPVNTNYEFEKTTPHFGEYPLSFAACLGQEACVRLLLAHGANPNLQDTNGNTVLHMTVIYNNREMFDLLADKGADLAIKNNCQLTPLTLAAKLGKKEMYQHILERIRLVYWVYGDVMCAGYPIEEIDSIGAGGKINPYSAAYQIVYGGTEKHLEMLEGGVIEDLLNSKWRTYVSFRFYRRAFIFLLYFLLFMVIIILRPGRDLKVVQTADDTTITPDVNQTRVVSGSNVTAGTGYLNDDCFLSRWETNSEKVRIVLEVILVLAASTYILLAVRELWHCRTQLFVQTLFAAPTKTLFLLSCIFVVGMVPGRVFCHSEFEEVMGLFAIMTCAPYFLFFCRSFRRFGPFVVMIYKMIMTDFLRFISIYLVFVMGFSQAMHIAFLGVPDTIFQYYDSFLCMFIMSLGDFEDLYSVFDEARYPELPKTIFLVYMVLVTLLMMNLLIAMMGNTYGVIISANKEYLRQWAKIVLVIEQTVTTQHRKALQLQYTQPLDAPRVVGPKVDLGPQRRVLVARWHMTNTEEESYKRTKSRTAQRARALLDRKYKQGFQDISSPYDWDT